MKKLIISFDTIRYRNAVLAQLDTLQTTVLIRHNSALQKVYNFKKDSILKLHCINSLKVQIEIYTGVYRVKKVNGGFIITSSTTAFELLKLDSNMKKLVDDIVNENNN